MMKKQIDTMLGILAGGPVIAFLSFTSNWTVPMVLGISTMPLYDRHLWRLDLALFQGVPITAMFREWLVVHAAVFGALQFVYELLYCLMVMLFLLACTHPEKLPIRTALIYLLATAPLGGLAYLLCPAQGPMFAFGIGDPGAVAFVTNYGKVGHPINATPSLHMTWALLLALAGRRFGKWPARLMVCFVIGTALATVGVCEHYVSDLIVAMPFALLITAIDERRLVRGLAAGALVIVWQVSIRFMPLTTDLFPVLIALAAVCGVQMFCDKPALPGRATNKRVKFLRRDAYSCKDFVKS